MLSKAKYFLAASFMFALFAGALPASAFEQYFDHLARPTTMFGASSDNQSATINTGRVLGATALTESQIQAILSLLKSFGADETTVKNTEAALRGEPVPPTPPTTATTTALIVSTDASSPAYRIVAAGSTNATVGAYKFVALNEPVLLRSIGMRLTSGVSGDVSKVSLYDGATKVGEGSYIGSGTQTIVTFLQPILIPQNSGKVLTVNADLGNIGTSQAVNVSGHLLKIDFYKGTGYGNTSGASVYTTDITNVAGVRIMKTFPVVVPDTLPSTGVADGRLMRFKVAADSWGPVGIGKMVFRVNATGASVTNGGLYAYTDSSYSQPVSGVGTGGYIPTSYVGGMYVAAPSSSGTPLQVPAGQVRYFEFRGSVSGASAASSVTTTLLSDPAFVPLQSGIVLREKDTNFVWSPNTTTTAPFSASDWTGGYAVPGLSASGLSFTRTGSGSVSSGISVTAPNGGEQWEIGQLNTVTWAPYGYNPDVNPARDVKVELMKRTTSCPSNAKCTEYYSVGTVMDTGKASLHTYFNLNNYQTWAEPGEYRVRATNTVTGASDMSDGPFTLLAPRVDLKVDGGDGPVAYALNDLVSFSWKTRDVEQCRIFGLKLKGYTLLPDGSYGYLPANGSAQGTFIGTDTSAIRMLCTKYNAGEWGDSVSVYVNQPGASASVQVTSPNGGEALNPNSQMVITAKSSGIKSFSIALYKNDQWKTWLIKDAPTSSSPDFPITQSFIPSTILQGLGEGDNRGAIWKAYITALKADGTGYVDDKSDAPFTFLGTVPTQTNPVSISSFTASGSSVAAGQSITLSWNSNLSATDVSYYGGFCLISLLTDANQQLHISGGNSGPSGTITYAPPASGTYTLRCSSGAKDGSPMAEKTVTVTVSGPVVATPVIKSFTASPSYITAWRGSAYLSWTTTNAQRCVLKYNAEEVSVNPNGNLTLFPLETTAYTLWCANDSGTGKDGPSTSKTITVYVDPRIVDRPGYVEP